MCWWVLSAGAAGATGLRGRYYEDLHGMDSERLFEMGLELRQKDSLDKAAACFHVISSRYDERSADDERQLCVLALNREGGIAFMRSNFSEAYRLFSRALTLADDSCRAECYNNLAVVYEMFKDFDKAKEYLEKSFDQSLQARQWENLQTTVHNLAYLDFATENYGGTADRRRRYMQLDSLPPDAHRHYTHNLCRGMDFLAAGQYADALGAFREAMGHTARLMQGDRVAADLYTYMAEAHFRLNDEQQGLRCLDMCEAIAREKGHYDILIDVYQQRARHFHHVGNEREAREARYQYMAIKDSLFSATEYGKIKDLLFYDELEKLERQIDRYDMERRLRTTVMAVTGVALLVTLLLLAWLVLQNRRLRKRNEDLFKKNVDYVAATDSEKRLRKEIGGIRSHLSQERRTDLQERIQEVMDDVETICSPDFSLERLAESVGSNAKYVSQVLNETMGTTFSQLLNKRRVGEVCRRLADHEHYGHLSIEAVAEGVGFRSRSHFTTNFRIETGLTPSQYRRMARREHP